MVADFPVAESCGNRWSLLSGNLLRYFATNGLKCGTE